MVKKQFFGKRKFIFTCVILILAVFLAIIYQNGFLGLQDKNYFANTELNKIQNVKLNKGDVSKVQFEIEKPKDVSTWFEELTYTVNFNWIDNENSEFLRPESINVVIYKDGEFYTIGDLYKEEDIKNKHIKKIFKKISKEKVYFKTVKILDLCNNTFSNFIKDFALKFFAMNGKRGQTTVLSNLGVIKLPEEYEKYVTTFSAIASTEDLHLCVCSYKNDLVLNFSSHFVSKDIERAFLKELQKEINDKILIISNIREDE